MGETISARLRKIFASAEQVAADEERSQAVKERRGRLIEDAQDRTRSTFSGVIRSVVFDPSRDRTVLEAELYDGTGSMALIWLGRRAIAGIEPGSRLSVTGLVTIDGGLPVMYNPMYELRVKPGEEH